MIYNVPKNKAANSLIHILRYKGIANPNQKELIRALAPYSEHDIDIVDCIPCVKSAGTDKARFSYDRPLNKNGDAFFKQW